MKIFHNLKKEILDEIKIDDAIFTYKFSKNPVLEKYDIDLKHSENNLFQIKYNQSEIIVYKKENVSKILKIIIELQKSKLQQELNKKKYLYEMKDKIEIYHNNVSLQKKLIYDNKFDCYNYNHFKFECKKEIEKYKRYSDPFSILLLDIDNFKQVNDNFGHSVGDIVLEKFIDAIKSNIRTIDTVFRFGGDEFIVILHKAMIAGSLIVAKRIQNSINNLSFKFQNKLIKNKVSTSIGIITVSEETDFFNNKFRVEYLFDKADKALYRAKDTGKNKIIHYEYCKQR